MLTRVLTSFLFEVNPADPVIFFAAFLCLCTVGILANLLSIRKAVAVDPIVELRCQ